LRRKAFSLRLVRETALTSFPQLKRISTTSDVYRFMAPFAAVEPTEVLWILPLTTQPTVEAPIVITRGLLNASLWAPREIFRAAMVANAAAIILVHNHPSGDPTPSSDDRSMTSQLVAAGRLLDIPVHDHVIIGHGRYASFAESGLLGI
jgi:DNA repair protein RadC